MRIEGHASDLGSRKRNAYDQSGPQLATEGKPTRTPSAYAWYSVFRADGVGRGNVECDHGWSGKVLVLASLYPKWGLMAFAREQRARRKQKLEALQLYLADAANTVVLTDVRIDGKFAAEGADR